MDCPNSGLVFEVELWLLTEVVQCETETLFLFLLLPISRISVACSICHSIVIMLVLEEELKGDWGTLLYSEDGAAVNQL